MTLTSAQKTTLLTLARGALKAFVARKPYEPGAVTYALHKPGASFVTLRKRGARRGCIGSVTALLPLYLDVIENARSAAHDPRYSPVDAAELKDITIEVSVLSTPKKLCFTNAHDLLVKLQPHSGVVIEDSGRSATSLPHLWDKLPLPGEFLSHLCSKAGLPPDQWRTSTTLTVKTFTVETLEE